MLNLKKKLLENKNIIKIIITIILIVIITRVSYAFFYYNKVTDSELIYDGYGKIDMVLNNLSSGIIVNNQYPMTDEEGKNQSTSYSFTISGYSRIEQKALNYKIIAMPGSAQEGKTLFDDLAIKLYLTDGQGNAIYGPDYANNFSSEGTILHVNYFSGGTEANKIVHNYILKVWISDKVIISNQNIEGKIAYTQEDYDNRYLSVKIKVEGYPIDAESPIYPLFKDVLLASNNIKGSVSYGNPGDILGGLYQWGSKYIYRGGITKTNPSGISSSDYQNDIDSGNDIDNFVKVPWETYGENENCTDNINNKCWRIISINSDNSITIVRDRPTDEEVVFDNTHNTAASTYYGDSGTHYGYNDLLGNTPTTGHPEEYRPYSLMYGTLYGVNGYQNTVLKNYYYLLQQLDVCLNKVDSYRGLNSEDYTTTGSVTDTCNVSGKNDVLAIAPLQNQYVRLPYMEEYINASLEATCIKAYQYQCRNKNYMYNKTYTWSLNGTYTESWCVFYLSMRGSASNVEAYDELGFRPVVVLKATTLITEGTGTSQNPYVIKS